MNEFFNNAAGWFFGPQVMALLFVIAIYISIRLNWIQFRRFGTAWSESWGAIRAGIGHRIGEKLSSFQAGMVVMGATVGMGNVVGVAVAIGTGGPGAFFWLWVAGLFFNGGEVCRSHLGGPFPAYFCRRQY